MKGASKNLNYFTGLAHKIFPRGKFIKPVRAPFMVHLNHNIFSGKMFVSGWENLNSITAGTLWARNMQNSYMLGSTYKMGLNLGQNITFNAYQSGLNSKSE